MGLVHATYNPARAGGVVQNAHPAVRTYPWIPVQTRVRPGTVTSQRGPGQVAGAGTQLVQPQEKGATFQPYVAMRRQLGLAPTSPARKEACPCSCGGDSGNSRSGDRG